MEMINRNNKRAFYVVQFVDLPFEGIDNYVCVPSTWIVVLRATDQKAVVAYPKYEDPFNTRERVRREENFKDEWKFYVTMVKYETDSYREAEFWIATRNDYGPVQEKLKTTDAEPEIPLNKKMCTAKPLPRISIKRSSPIISIKRMSHNNADVRPTIVAHSHSCLDSSCGRDCSREEIEQE